MKKISSITIDGPAGVGKSTISKLLAERLSTSCLNTGAIYRALTLECLRKNANIKIEAEVEKALKDFNLSVVFNNGQQHILLNNKDVTQFLHREIIDQTVAYVAKVPSIREKVRGIQRQIATENNIVVEGRDIGTVVLPDSINKFFLTASAEVRAERRYKERVQNGEKADYNQILTDIKLRDELDITRKVSPLLPAKDAIIVNTDNKSIEQILSEMQGKIKGFDKERCQ